MSMLNNMIMGQYVDRNSVVHRLDPRTKIITVFLGLLTILLLEHTFSYISALLVIYIMVSCTRIPVKYIIRGLKPVWIIIAITFLFHILWSQGEEILINFGFITLYTEGLVKAINFSLRIISLVVAASLLTLTTRSTDLMDGLEKLLTPLRKMGLPTQQFALMISITLRFIPILLQETDRIIKAQKSRGVNFAKGTLFKRIYQFIPVVIPLLILAFQKAEHISLAIEARGYQPGMVRTQLRSLHFSKNDYASIFISILIFMIVVNFKYGSF